MVLQLETQPPLVQAVFAGNLEDVRSALDRKHDINQLDSEKRTALHAAAYRGDIAVAWLLVSRGARVNAKDNRWITPLHWACCCASAEVAALLLRHKAETTVRDRQWQTPLHVAAANNSYDCVKLLLDRVPNVNVMDRMGRTALHHAALNGHTEIVELLLSKGCIVNACDKRDCRPLHCAAYMGHIETIKMLLHYRADINAKDHHLYTPLHVAAASGMDDACHILLDYGAQIDVRNSYGNTPLYISCLNGHLSVCELLVRFGADVEAKNYRGQTPLHIAAASTHGVDCMNYLIEKGVDINRQSLDGRTPLHMTAIHGRFTRSKTLIDAGAVVDCVDKNNCTALHIAALYGHDLLSNTLLSHGADASKAGYMGRTPLHMSCLSGHVECCRKFLQANVDFNARDESGKTPIHCAAYKGSVECLDLLTSNGADFNILDNIGRLPLHYAAVQGHYSCVFTLVGLKSSVNLCDADGCSPLHLAAAYDFKGECINYLLQHKADPKLKDCKGFTPIHYAVRGDNKEGLRYLLASVGNNYIMYGPDMPLTTPLHLAAHGGNQSILELLLRYFLDVNIRTEHGCTALLLAARGGYTYCVQTLLRFGAKVTVTDEVHRMTPIHYSAKNGNMHCLALLLDNAEDQKVIDALDGRQRTALMLSVAHGHNDCALTLLKCGANPNVVDADKHSSLFRAVGNGHQTAVELLISHGAEVDRPDVYGKTVLHLAASCGRLHSLNLLLKHISPDTIATLDNQKCSALHWACYSGYPACVSHLLNQEVFKELSGNVFSPVHCATFSGTKHCLELLRLYYGVKVIQLRDARNRNPLHIACLHGHVDCAKYLLEQGAEINCKDSDGRTPLIAAAQNGQSQVIEILINHKADMTFYDNNGNTALHLACLKRHNHAALLLLENIDDIDIVNMINNDRKTPLHLSARNGLVDVTRELIRKGSSVLAIDANGMTPALCCAPNNNVAQCLALILGNYAICTQPSSDTKAEFVKSLTCLFDTLTPKLVVTKVHQNELCQTNITLIHNPDYFEWRRLFSVHGDRKLKSKQHHASQTYGPYSDPETSRWLVKDDCNDFKPKPSFPPRQQRSKERKPRTINSPNMPSTSKPIRRVSVLNNEGISASTSGRKQGKQLEREKSCTDIYCNVEQPRLERKRLKRSASDIIAEFNTTTFKVTPKVSQSEIKRLRNVYDKIVADKLSLWKDTECEQQVDKIIEGLKYLLASNKLNSVLRHVHGFYLTLSKWPETLSTSADIMDITLEVIKKAEHLEKLQLIISRSMKKTERPDNRKHLSSIEPVQLNKNDALVESSGDACDEKKVAEKIAKVKETKVRELSTFHEQAMAYFPICEPENLAETCEFKQHVISGTVSSVLLCQVQKEMEENVTKVNETMEKCVCIVDENKDANLSITTVEEQVTVLPIEMEMTEIKEECGNIKRNKSKRIVTKYTCLIS